MEPDNSQAQQEVSLEFKSDDLATWLVYHLISFNQPAVLAILTKPSLEKF